MRIGHTFLTNTMGFLRIPDMVSKPSNPFNSVIAMAQFSGFMQIAASHIYGKESVLRNYTYDRFSCTLHLLNAALRVANLEVADADSLTALCAHRPSRQRQS